MGSREFMCVTRKRGDDVNAVTHNKCNCSCIHLNIPPTIINHVTITTSETGILLLKSVQLNGKIDSGKSRLLWDS